MKYIILLIVIIIIAVVIRVLISKPKTGNATKAESNLSDNQRYYIGDKCIGLSPRKGYDKFSIAGVYYRDLPITMVGKFNGYAIAQIDNEHDQYAIAIYNDNEQHLGFLPRGNDSLHSYILNDGGKVHAYGYIGCRNDGEMYGEACVETDKNLVTKRNKSYAID